MKLLLIFLKNLGEIRSLKGKETSSISINYSQYLEEAYEDLGETIILEGN